MAILLGLISAWLKHNTSRTIGVVLVSTLIFSVPYMVYSKGYNVGFSKGYAKAIADRPTYENVGTVINAPANEFKILGMSINIWKLRLKLGI